MTKQIEFSSIVDLVALNLNEFEANYPARVKHHQMTWETAWREILQVALLGKGPDLSEIGTTWLGSLVGLSAVYPFKKYEIQQIGGGNMFLPTSWSNCMLPADEQVWAIPFSADTRHVYYRRDVLEKFGIDEKSAFDTAESLLDTLARLKSYGVPVPIALPTNSNILHVFASWVWGSGGEFRSPDGRKIWLTEPAARAGIVQYFRIHPYVAPAARNLSIIETDLLFMNGQAAMAISGGWLLHRIKGQRPVHPEVSQNTGIACLPGVPYLGGSVLTIWAHSVYEEEMIQLIRYLVQPRIQELMFQLYGNLPVTNASYGRPPFTTDPNYQVVFESIQRGRTFGNTWRWGVVEEKLMEMVRKLWKDVFNQPELYLEEEVETRIIEAAREIEKKLLTN